MLPHHIELHLSALNAAIGIKAVNRGRHNLYRRLVSAFDTTENPGRTIDWVTQVGGRIW